MAKKILFVRIKASGTSVTFNTVLGTLESSKWVGSIRSPINGTILESNPRIKKNPSLINEEPYGEGWIVVLKPNRLEEDLANLKFGEKALEAFKTEIIEKKLKKE